MKEWWSQHWPAIVRRTGLVYPFIFILMIVEGQWRAKRYAKKHPERGI